MKSSDENQSFFVSKIAVELAHKSNF